MSQPTPPGSSVPSPSLPTRPAVRGHIVKVIDTVDFTPWYRRVVVDPCGLFERYDPKPGAHLLLSVDDGECTVSRAYSIGGVTPTSFWCEFVLHEGGPGARWAASVTPGAQIAVSVPPYNLVIPKTGHALLVADPTAWAAARSLLVTLTRTMSVFLLLVDHHPDRDLVPFDSTNATIAWADHLSEDALRSVTAQLSRSDCFVWAGGERSMVKTVREHLRTQFQVAKDHQHLQTYWIAR